jgi:phosphopantothenoylcysteine synthetase/decarboxylase
MLFSGVKIVSDYSIKNIAKNKIKKSEKTLILELTPTKDILQEVCKLTKKPHLWVTLLGVDLTRFFCLIKIVH